jgi:CRP/FNR family cyclic AMP-dependent transcriptional regulator
MKKLFLRLLSSRVECRHWEVLHKIHLFETLTRRELGIVELILHERAYLGDEIVFEEAEQGLGMYIILSGSVRILRHAAAGGTREIGVLGPGESFGEIALIKGVKRSATAVAQGPTRLLSLFQPEFLRLISTHHRIGAKMSYEMASALANRFHYLLEKDPTSETLQ